MSEKSEPRIISQAEEATLAELALLDKALAAASPHVDQQPGKALAAALARLIRQATGLDLP